MVIRLLNLDYPYLHLCVWHHICEEVVLYRSRGHLGKLIGMPRSSYCVLHTTEFRGRLKVRRTVPLALVLALTLNAVHQTVIPSLARARGLGSQTYTMSPPRRPTAQHPAGLAVPSASLLPSHDIIEDSGWRTWISARWASLRTSAQSFSSPRSDRVHRVSSGSAKIWQIVGGVLLILFLGYLGFVLFRLYRRSTQSVGSKSE